jgi:general secretion pathway protein L
MQPLFIQIPSRADAPLHWWSPAIGGGQAEHGRGPLQALADVVPGRHIVLLLPTEQILLSELVLETRSRRQLMRAAPYALEEELAAPVESLHFALGTTQAGRTPVAAVDAQTLSGWIADIGALGAQPRSAVPDALALPLEADHWTVLIEDERALVRTGPAGGFACERENLKAWIEAALAETDEASRPEALRVWTAGAEAPALDDLGPTIQLGAVETPLLGLLAGKALPAALELLQGPYSYRDSRRRALRPWYAAAAVLVASVLLAFTVQGIEWARLGGQVDALDARITQVYQQTFPGSRVQDARAQMQIALRGLETGVGGSAFFELLDALSRELSGRSEVTLTALDYRGARLDADLRAASPQVLDALRQRLAATGLRAELQGISTAGDVATAQLRLSRAGT